MFEQRANVNGCRMVEGTTVYEYTKSVTIKSKNGVDLREVKVIETETVLHYELYMDGELVNRYNSVKVATSMWKDFSA